MDVRRNPIINLEEITNNYAAALIGLGVEPLLAEAAANCLVGGTIPYNNLQQMQLKRALLAVIQDFRGGMAGAKGMEVGHE